ncbi:UDP-N-acetylmuramoyl-L-alanyl-D-glutamate--2,6-diaminopimelate ligase [bacterium]|nr:UDP-N-acetylmuramoyl-L-alanyl-D-glutamate--2,6-diaminopimelate ligase [bacterium]
MIRLKDLLPPIGVKEIHGSTELSVKGITYDSRQVKPDYIFVAISGYTEDGNYYIPQALEAGAAVVISSKRIEKLTRPSRQGGSATQIVVENPRKALANLATIFYNYPSDKLNIIGITGTNGKTTVSYLAEAIFKENGAKVGVLGTIAYRLGEKILPAPITTPQSSDLQQILRKLVDEKFSTVVMEVSSHALSLDRVEGCEFDSALFTNLSREHLDFHKSMEEYLKEKIKLFSVLGKDARKEREKLAVLNLDDPSTEKIIQSTEAKIITYGIEKKADVVAKNIKLNLEKTTFTLLSPNGETKISLPLIGKYNVYNALAASTVALGQGISLDIIKSGLEKVSSIPGRFEKIDCGQPFTVIVDYAHTDEALRELLHACGELKPRRIITVFGCGGDRDRGKRPLMGEVAVDLSDYVLVTSDNPRSEDPERIALDIEVGIKRKGKSNYQTIIDRFQAIEKALSMAKKGDLIAIAGKGHEDYQLFKDRRIHFDDREVARKILSEKMRFKKE